MNEAAMKKKLVELAEEMRVAPIRTVGAMNESDGVYLPNAATVELSAEDTLEHLSLQIKYLLFDLEATRRENRYLRQMLEGRPPAAGAEDNGDYPQA